MNNTITYEFPLNERIRVFIRLEQLFQQFNHFLTGPTVADKRAAIATLLDIMSIFRRNDLKSEILKELDRHAKVLNKIATSQSVNTEKVHELLDQISDISQKLYAANGKIGIHVMESDLFQSVTQRSSIPGGTCSFDLPEYHYWLEQDEPTRLRDLERWSSPFTDVRNAIDLILNFIRNSDAPSQEVAVAGFFQFSLDRGQPYQLIKVSVDKTLSCFAEISGGKHRCSIRFMKPSEDDKRPTQSHDDIPFTLNCCLF
ncbi:MAG: cell division protein ZapD [Methylococcaceae bacterium]|nr:cell division protein ZapD [Methylococcaceae bacterium]MDZ4156774.1 cell division protein ZapD [Methylococcales bacterium]MDP2393322.1 cell division protein ZapD [Methylococcaceae bacterium]MDP3018357.1 cell division protein ZapD [Methylococcaceae bacterium]MDP3391592.1 cell division protein ZapD [Methylococcaceae bacterium]